MGIWPTSRDEWANGLSYVPKEKFVIPQKTRGELTIREMIDDWHGRAGKPEEEIPMKKFWMVYTNKNEGLLSRFETREEAEDEAKRRSDTNKGSVYFILEAMTAVRSPAPPAEVTSLEVAKV